MNAEFDDGEVKEEAARCLEDFVDGVVEEVLGRFDASRSIKERL